MDSKSSPTVWNRFPGGKDMNLLFNGFKGSNEEKMGRKQREEVL